MKKHSPGVRIVFDRYWYWILSPRTCDYEITGKYLFFSTVRERLVDIATQEIFHHHFHKAKVNSSLIGNSTEYVLCLYYKDDSRKHELAKRCARYYPDVKYRYWKSDESTLRGQYSQEFLNKLDAKRRRSFTTPKRLVEFRDSKGKVILRQAATSTKKRVRKLTTG